MDLSPVGGNNSKSQLEPVPPTVTPIISPSLVVNQARVERENVVKGREKKKTERRVKGMAIRSVTLEHHHPHSRSIQFFLKSCLGGPTKPQEYPSRPSEAEKQSQYWVERRSQFIMEQLAMVRRSLSDKSVAEQDFFVSRAEDEIRKHIKLPPFTPATHVAKVRGSRPISSQVKGDVERELALVGISRMTYDWMAGPAEECTWNLGYVVW